MLCSMGSIFTNSGALEKGHGDVERDAGRITTTMDLARRDIDANEKCSVALDSHVDSRPITGGLRLVKPLARDRVDGHTTGSRDIFRDDIDVRRSLRFVQAQPPGNGAKQVITGIGPAHRFVRIEYELASARAAQDRAEARRNNLRHSERSKRAITRRQQSATKQNLSESRERVLRP